MSLDTLILVLMISTFVALLIAANNSGPRT